MHTTAECRGGMPPASVIPTYSSEHHSYVFQRASQCRGERCLRASYVRMPRASYLRMPAGAAAYSAYLCLPASVYEIPHLPQILHRLYVDIAARCFRIFRIFRIFRMDRIFRSVGAKSAENAENAENSGNRTFLQCRLAMPARNPLATTLVD